ncbi:MAG: KEOPS complex kinase/ATPase Bud32 [Candidatus Micrarchaeota archaeon]|nr:KEOPS complex kinase/ATPase Bud32 [Candidatus Micrarchaeota archaeon]
MRNSFQKRGAEAKVYFSNLFGVPVVIKVRDEKKYRIKELDESLRKSRNRVEARCVLHAARNSINVPRIYHAGKYELVLERLDGVLMKDRKNTPAQIKKVGILLAKLHSAGITHGDFTPANVMFVKEEPYIIDFGLAQFSNDTEERAIDVLLMKRSLGRDFRYFLEGYKAQSNWKETISQMEEIEKRGRYHKRGETKDKESDDEMQDEE